MTQSKHTPGKLIDGYNPLMGSLPQPRKITPGPWRIECSQDELLHTGCHTIGERPCISIWAPVDGGFYHEIALVSHDDLANARLIAAAPELLEALKHLLHRYEYDRPRDDAGSQQARAAIAKATQG